MLQAIKIKRVTDKLLCISRKRYGRGFQYFDENGAKITDEKELKRLRNLVIPPMWDDVKICKTPRGHIQAIGRDGKDRKQYIYHEAWERKRQDQKFQKMKTFGAVLPTLRKKAFEDLESPKWTKEKVLALMILVLDQTGIRIGNQYYANKNETYGLSTLRRKHLQQAEGELQFSYKGKSNKNRTVSINDTVLCRHVQMLAEQTGYEIFRYRESAGKWSNINSDEVNEYIQEEMGENFSSKDFRTWVASRLAMQLYPEARSIKEVRPRKKIDNLLVELVAKELGNTKSVCRTYYIHPKVLAQLENSTLPTLSKYATSKNEYDHSAAEKALLSLLA